MKKVLITGGAGFVGSNLAHVLVKQGHAVTIIDNFHKDYGSNEYNFTGIRDKITVYNDDITDVKRMAELFEKHSPEIVYHVAAQCSHVDSMTDPWLDIDYNCRGTMSILEAARKLSRKPAMVYLGTRAEIGAPLQFPVTETTLPNPTDIYGVNKLAAELYGSVYARVHKMPFVSIRLTNCYGPRHQMKNGKYGILNWFVSLALQNKPIKVFGEGKQLRDYLYIDDAIEALVLAGEFAESLGVGTKRCSRAQIAGPEIPFAVFNIATGKGLAFADCARKVVDIAGSPIEFVPWPADRKAIETGDFVADTTAAKEGFGWNPRTSFDDGLKKTIQYYREHLKFYL